MEEQQMQINERQNKFAVTNNKEVLKSITKWVSELVFGLAIGFVSISFALVSGVITGLVRGVVKTLFNLYDGLKSEFDNRKNKAEMHKKNKKNYER